MLKVFSNVLPIEFQIFLVILIESFLFPRYFSDLAFVLNGNVFFGFMLIPQNLFSVWSSVWLFSSCVQFWLTRKMSSDEIDSIKNSKHFVNTEMKMSRNLWFANFSVCIRPEPRIAARFCGFFEVYGTFIKQYRCTVVYLIYACANDCTIYRYNFRFNLTHA